MWCTGVRDFVRVGIFVPQLLWMPVRLTGTLRRGTSQASQICHTVSVWGWVVGFVYEAFCVWER